ncbi:MAG: hypothetical protein NTU47_06535 [Ignavibacteriales bacterium]|nr:hypothetical protein [Ignavibacteriales bacterium]
MKASAAKLICLVALASVTGCERELPFMAQVDQSIDGYRIEGYVTDKLGIPVKGLKIALWYSLEFVDNIPPVRQFNVDDPTKVARVVVLDQQNRVRRVLFQGRANPGILGFEFDLRDSAGALLPTGIYTVRFSMDGVTKGAYTQVINGAVTAVTDSLGHYAIPNESLPIGFSPAPIYSGDSAKFIGNYRVSSYPILEFYLPVHRSASVSLTQNQLTRFDYRI